MRRRIIPLANFESQVDTVDFGNGYALERLDEGELSLISNEFTMAQHFSRARWETIRFKLASVPRSTSQDGHIREWVIQSEPAVEIIRAMRLRHAGDICAPICVDYTPAHPTWAMSGFLPAKRLGSTYQFKQEDVSAVAMQMALLADNKCKTDNRLGNALRRFDDIHGRNRDDETIIDCFTALESCLTTEASAEIGYRLALRAAAILVRTHQPEDVRILVSAGYDARSKIVHEGLSMGQLFSNKDFKKKLRRLKEARGLDVNIDCITPTSFTIDLVECLRSILRVVIAGLCSGCDNTEKLVNSLDDNIAAALSHVEPLPS